MSFYPQSPQTIGRVLDAGLQLYRKSLKSILPLSFAAGALSQAPQLFPLMLQGQVPGGTSVAIGVIGFVIWFAVYLALYNGLLKSMHHVGEGRAALGFGEAFSTGLPTVLRTMGAFFLYALAIIIGGVLLVIPGVILAGSLLMFWYFVVLEDTSAVDSLKRSHKLIWGHWWRTMTVIGIGGLIYAVGMIAIGGGVGIVVGVSAAGAAESAGTVLIAMLVVQALLTALLAPMWNAIMLVQFRDLQLRKSGSDLAARAATA